MGVGVGDVGNSYSSSRYRRKACRDKCRFLWLELYIKLLIITITIII